jgi:WhiB family transcriptional regulator, redox-sensing transcriptional regulator
MSEPSNWQARAACAGMDTGLFFPGRNENPAEAVAVCRQCPVRDSCLEEHLGEFRGIFGGMTERQRSSLRARAKRGGAECGSTGGYHRHRRRQELPCRPCLDAKAALGRAERAAKKQSAA